MMDRAQLMPTLPPHSLMAIACALGPPSGGLDSFCAK